MRFFQPFLKTKYIRTEVFYTNRAGCEVPAKDIAGHLERLMDLMVHTVIFPNPIEMLALGKKVASCTFLRLAATSLGHNQPNVLVKENPPTWDEVEEIINGVRTTVMKRDYSKAGALVIRKDSQLMKKEFLSSLKAAEIWEGLPFGLPRWVEQPYIPELLHMGEVRALIINGVITYQLLSTPKSATWEVEVIRKVRPRDLMKYDLFFNVSLLKTEF